MPKHTILFGNAIECLRSLPSDSIHMAVTSPAYYGPRNYFTRLIKWRDGWIGEIGREPDPRMYVDHLLEVFDEVKRVLRPDGTFWLNIGDTYNGSGGSGGDYNKDGIREGQPKVGPIKIPWLKEKDMIGIPWMVAFAMRDQSGWYLRSDVIWSKSNPPPESPTDRPVKAHEYIFEFAKSSKYYYDRYAVLEPLAQPNIKGPKFGGTKFPGRVKSTYSGREYDASKLSGRNKRDVWTFSTAGGFRGGSHLAVFPPTLPEICIRAGTSEYGCCSICGKPYKRVVEIGEVDEEWAKLCGADSKGEYKGKDTKDYTGKLSQTPGDIKRNVLKSLRPKFTTEWKKMCKCEGSVVVPCTVLDPFLGSGTTTKVAMALGRSSIGIELNASYIKDMKIRIGVDIESHNDFTIVDCGEE